MTSLPVGLNSRTGVFLFVTSLPVGLKGRTRVRHCYFRFVTSLPVGLKGRTRVRHCYFRFVTSLPVGKHAVHLHDIRVMTSLPVMRYFVTSLPVGFRGYTPPRVHIPEGTHPPVPQRQYILLFKHQKNQIDAHYWEKIGFQAFA